MQNSGKYSKILQVVLRLGFSVVLIVFLTLQNEPKLLIMQVFQNFALLLSSSMLLQTSSVQKRKFYVVPQNFSKLFLVEVFW